MTYRTLSTSLVTPLVKKQSGKDQYLDIYAYGLEIILSTVVNLVIVILLGTLLGILKETLFFIITFSFLRILVGGAHASTHLRCITLFTLIMLVSVYLCTMSYKIMNMTPISLTMITVSLGIHAYHMHKTFKPTRILLAPLFIITLCSLSTLFTQPNIYFHISIYGMFIQSLSLFISILGVEKNVKEINESN